MRIAIVGAGIVGASAGYEAARSGAEVVLVDADFDGKATAAGAGILSPWTSSVTDLAWLTLALRGVRHYRELRAALAEDGEHEIGYRRVGALRLVTEDDAESVLDRTRHRAGTDPDAGEIQLIPRSRARALFPPLDPHGGAAVYVGGAGRVDGRQVTESLLRAAEGRGAKRHIGTASLLTTGTAVSGVQVGDELIEADAVIVAAGAWAPRLLAPLGIETAVRTQRGQIVHLGLPGIDTADWPVVLPANGHYLLAFDDSRVVVGATREHDTGFDYRATAAGLTEVLHQALTIAPELANATHLETRIGFRPMSPDSRPLLGTVPGHEGLVIANGLGPSGLTMGPYVGKLAADLARGVEPDLELAPYDPLRW